MTSALPATLPPALAKVLATAARGGHVAANRITLAEWLDRWLKDDVKGSARYSTYEAYSGIVKLHLKPSLGKKKLTHLQPTTSPDYTTRSP